MHALPVKSIRVLSMEPLVEKPSFPKGIFRKPWTSGMCMVGEQATLCLLIFTTKGLVSSPMDAESCLLRL